MRHHMPSTTSAFTSSDSRTYNSHVLTRATCVLVPSNIMISLMISSSTNRFDQPINLTRFESPATKKNVRKKMLWPIGPLTLTKKSTFSKRAYPTQFSAYIPILESTSLFKTRKLCKQSNFQKVDFCTNPDRKSKFSRRTCLAQLFA